MSNVCCCRFAALLLLCGLWCWPIALVQGQRVSELQCQRYIAMNTEESAGGPLSLDPEVVVFRRTNCSTSIDLIVNGEEAIVGEFPHQALLGVPMENGSSNQWDFYCGGSLISEWFILTAAHCKSPTIVRLGEHDLREPTYDEEDIELARQVEFNQMIRPACLWTSDPFNMSNVVATGFGRTEHGNQHGSPVLMKAVLNVMDQMKCRRKFTGYLKLTEGIKAEQMCVGSKEGRKDTCYGDSGGPIQVATDVNTCAYYIVGITSYGGVCGIGTSESVYTKVASYLDWIEQTVWPYEYLESREDQTTEKDTTLFDSSRIYFPDS
ncbi:serine protease snake isoform X2 [Aedes aegypti]|uniref:Uncharacterized protein n=1 Tax=Aedes aegypti TaxID=7159 RepID=A0A6I8TBI7_AEDAE|nr:serine protease snake isoform X2 [Aedes aegypti]